MENRLKKIEDDLRELRAAVAKSQVNTEIAAEISSETAQQILKEVQEARILLDAVEEAVERLKQAGGRLGRVGQTS